MALPPVPPAGQAPAPKARRPSPADALSTLLIPAHPVLGELLLLDHSHPPDLSAGRALAHQTDTALAAALAIIRQGKAGYRRGSDAAHLHLSGANTTITLKRAELSGPTNLSQLKADLAQLATHPQTALDLNRRPSVHEIAETVDQAASLNSPDLKLDLQKLGIKASPNLVGPLSEYTSGGRNKLVAEGLLEASPVETQPAPKREPQPQVAPPQINRPFRRSHGEGL